MLFYKDFFNDIVSNNVTISNGFVVNNIISEMMNI